MFRGGLCRNGLKRPTLCFYAHPPNLKLLQARQNGRTQRARARTHAHAGSAAASLQHSHAAIPNIAATSPRSPTPAIAIVSRTPLTTTPPITGPPTRCPLLKDPARGAVVHVEDTLRGGLPRPLPGGTIREQAQHGVRGPEKRGGVPEQAGGAGAVEPELRNRTGD